MNQPEVEFSRLDAQIARFLAGRSGLTKADKAVFERLVQQLSYQLAHGNCCILVERNAESLLRLSRMVSEHGATPLVLENGRLYFHRYWQYENQLASNIRRLVENPAPLDIDEASFERYLPQVNTETNWQRKTAEIALASGFSIITGGPGTGKTTTVAKIIALLLEASENPLHVALAAPTGKAAMRLEQSIGQNQAAWSCAQSNKDKMPEKAHTLHRLLGAMPPSPYFRHNEENPLPYDVVIVDEASMVDLALMSKLAAALKKDARLILLGDADQLASIESGAVLADLSNALPEQTTKLQKTYRFDENIAALAKAVNRQQPDQTWDILNSPSMENIKRVKGNLVEDILNKQTKFLELIKKKVAFPDIYRVFNSFQVLCANRQGADGAAEINRQIEQRLAEQNLITPIGQWYSGRPVLITQNNHHMQLYNGDIGICLPANQLNGKLMVYFQRPDGSVNSYLPARLPHCETVFAMTIHKSQGSEFDEVLIVLPEKYNLVLTKELLYTAITRAKKSVAIKTNRDVLEQTLRKRIRRYGGLLEKLASQGK